MEKQTTIPFANNPQLKEHLVINQIAAAFYMKYQAGEMGNLLNFSDDPAMQKIWLGNQIQLVTYLVFMVAVAWSMVKVLIKLNSQQIRAFFD